NPANFVSEAARVLAPGGTFIVSTPEVRTYSPHGHWNEAHCSEMTEEQFVELLSKHFTIETMYGQRNMTTAWSALGRGLASEDALWRRLCRWMVEHDKPLRKLPGYWRVRNFLYRLLSEKDLES